MLVPFTQSTSPTPTSLNDALAGATWRYGKSKRVTVMFNMPTHVCSCLYSRFCKITIVNPFSCSFHCSNSGYLSWIRSLACCAPYHWNWIAPLPKKTFWHFVSGGLCVEPNPSMHKYFEVHRPSCELVKNCPLAAPRKICTRSHGPPKRLPWCLRRMESASAGLDAFGVFCDWNVWRWVVYYYCNL